MDYSHPTLADALAAQYALGTLRGPARRRFEQLLPAHPALRAALHRWEDGLLPLSQSLAPVPPPAAVWRRIEARIGAADGAAAQTGPSNAHTMEGSWWSRLALWRGVSALASACALGLAVLLANPGPAQPPVVVVLGATAAPASFVAGISADGRAVVTRPLQRVSVQPGRALELWALAPAGMPPRSLGVISSNADTTLVQPDALKGATGLAVSLEPPGGSPTGAPTGPVLYAGQFKT